MGGFLSRQAAAEGLDEEKKGKMELVQEILKEVYELPDDDTLKISRDLELIFLQNNRREIPVPKDEPVKDEEIKDEPIDDQENPQETSEENGAENAEVDEVKEEAEEVTEAAPAAKSPSRGRGGRGGRGRGRGRK